MSQKLARSAQTVQYALEQKNVQCKVLELPNSCRTAQEAASSIGCAVSQIVKSLIFKTRMTVKPVLVLVSGPNRVNEKIIESYISEEIIKADAVFTKELTGFAIGGIPPIGHKHAIKLVFIDQDLLRFDDLWAAAGTPNAVFNIQVKDLLLMTNGRIVSVN
ncbi:MAG: YbaK/aminoacyl-tRNA synthetase associated region [Rickettsiaceae bacterium]|jgi:prolyl-tRNA editing enzyme YbaK/EbsC (Cys-tRNA(Pro) deacylase)|nr:YbaK/aminoacyl-tRNA synthetase associated region [Rickettsiaceae bacterium]